MTIEQQINDAIEKGTHSIMTADNIKDVIGKTLIIKINKDCAKVTIKGLVSELEMADTITGEQYERAGYKTQGEYWRSKLRGHLERFKETLDLVTSDNLRTGIQLYKGKVFCTSLDSRLYPSAPIYFIEVPAETFCIWDGDARYYIESGKNSKTKEECIEAGLSYLYMANEFDEIKKEEVDKLPLEEKEALLAAHGFIIENHFEIGGDNE